MPNLVNCLWFDDQAEDAALFYASVFKNFKAGATTCYPDEGREIHGKPAGAVMTVEFEVLGQKFLALNGGPSHKFNEAISFQILCDTQGEIDYFWEKLTKDGGAPGPCGWLKDKYGVSWQVVPSLLLKLFRDPVKAPLAMKAMLQMTKLELAAFMRL